jgi:homoserine dehydrogenase
VGGAVPVLEALAAANAREARVVAVRGVVNGTCNYVLDRLAEGLDLAAAIAGAQAAGYAEPDPTFDVSGQDAAYKLQLIVALATGQPPGTLDVQGLDEHTAELQRDALAAGRRVKLVASWDASEHAGTARVGLESLPADDPLAQARAEQNVVELAYADGTRSVLHGRGAGREPTTTPGVADLLDVLPQVREDRASAERASPERLEPRAAEA